jgi:hypothetical protein
MTWWKSSAICVGSYVLAMFGATEACAETFKAKAVEPIAGEVACKWARDRLITLISGPCENYKPPVRVRLGETFQANGKARTIKVIFADRIEKNMPELNLRAGDWTCVAAEAVSDIPVMSGKKDHTGTWLYIAKCRPLE